MTDLDQLLPLWQEVDEAGEDYVLATIVAVEGSGYRKPGARMLIAENGRRAGTISGGCLEAEVAKKAFWHTENGPVMRRYSTAAEDGDVPFGMGCGGVVHVLLERAATAGHLMRQLATQFNERRPVAIATVLEGEQSGSRAIWADGHLDEIAVTGQLGLELHALARKAFDEKRSFSCDLTMRDTQVVHVWVEFCAARPGLFVFGAGDDTIPLVRMARQLGWYVSVSDGRSHLATRARFPDAHDVHVLVAGDFPVLPLRPTDAAVSMTHSLEQDTRVLTHVLPLELGYLGVLGPQRRTEDILRDVAEAMGHSGESVNGVADTWLKRIHAPMGLDLGGETPRDIALAITAEIQQNRNKGTALPLRTVRGRIVERVSEPAIQ